MPPPSLEPSALRIVTYPAPALRTKARPVPLPPSDESRAVAERMIELMRQADGIGLAAPQVGLPWRLFVVDIPPAPRPADTQQDAAEDDPPAATDGPEVYLNPVLSSPTGPAAPMEEGCLSLPDIRGDVLRPPVITITAHDLDGRPFTRTAGGLLARCWQHEMDHLDGVLIIDRMTPLSRIKNRAAVRNLERQTR